MKGKRISGLMVLSTIFTVLLIAIPLRFTRCLGEFMPLREVEKILWSNDAEDIYRKKGYFVDKRFEKDWISVDGDSRIFVKGIDIGTGVRGIRTSKYSYSDYFEANLSNGATTRGVFLVEDFRFVVIYEDIEYKVEYDNGYQKNEEMERTLGLSTEEIVNEVRSAKEHYITNLNKVAKLEWARIQNKTMRNVVICAVLWFLTIIQYVYRYRKNKAME